jgi:hypothetical protein
MSKSKLGIEKMDFDRIAHWENVYSTKQTTEVDLDHHLVKVRNVKVRTR